VIPERLVGRAVAWASGDRRVILGVCGAPGAGKSTVAAWLAASVAERCGDAAVVVVPMDGFHLAQRELERLGRVERKGAPDTFDHDGYVALLRRLRSGDEAVTWAPAFDRAIEEPINAAIAVPSTVRLVITEGNYLLHWDGAAALCDQVWFVDVDPLVRHQRLIARHVEFGRTTAAAEAHALGSDEANARLIDATRHLADEVIST
jgi:pantothenate kinase